MHEEVRPCLPCWPWPSSFQERSSPVFGEAAAPRQITIKDPAEYNEYTNAVGQSTPLCQGSGDPSFLTKYPYSVVKNDML